VEVIDEFFVGAVNGDAGWKPIGLSGIDGVFLAEISIQNGIAQFGFGEGFVGAVPVSIGAWNNYSIDVNFATGAVSGFVDGVLIATQAPSQQAPQMLGSFRSASTTQAGRPLRALRTICHSLPEFRSPRPGQCCLRASRASASSASGVAASPGPHSRALPQRFTKRLKLAPRGYSRRRRRLAAPHGIATREPHRAQLYALIAGRLARRRSRRLASPKA
jgi:hypothetical protein